jgi:hypothetical protein
LELAALETAMRLAALEAHHLLSPSFLQLAAVLAVDVLHLKPTQPLGLVGVVALEEVEEVPVMTGLV